MTCRTPGKGSDMTRNRAFFFKAAMVLFLFVVTACILELGSYVVMVVKKKSVFLQSDFSARDMNRIKEKTAGIFSHDLGWEPDMSNQNGYRGMSYCNPHGYRGTEKDVGRAAICLFGDSFTVGCPVIEKSWPYLLEKKIGRPVLNFGVGGYGTDQAYLRFEKRYVGHIDTPYVCLVVLSENIARIVNRYRGFYERSSAPLPPKPMFYRETDGSIRLLPNPLKDHREIALLGDISFLRQLGEQDYWFGFYEQYGFNRGAHFPYAYFFLKQAPFYMRKFYETRVRNNYDFKRLYGDDNALAVMEYILLRFVTRVRESGSTPIILFLPVWSDLIDFRTKGRTVYQDFYHRIRGAHSATYDGASYFAPHLDAGEDIASFFISSKNRHPNPYGERIISQGFYNSLKALDAERNLLKAAINYTQRHN